MFNALLIKDAVQGFKFDFCNWRWSSEVRSGQVYLYDLWIILANNSRETNWKVFDILEVETWTFLSGKFSSISFLSKLCGSFPLTSNSDVSGKKHRYFKHLPFGWNIYGSYPLTSNSDIFGQNQMSAESNIDISKTYLLIEISMVVFHWVLPSVFTHQALKNSIKSRQAPFSIFRRNLP